MYKNWLIILGIGILSQSFTGCKHSIENSINLEKQPQIFPDYTSLVIPYNIAPLNFDICENGTEYFVEIFSKNGDKISIHQSSPKIEIPVKSWHKMLTSNKGNILNFAIYVKRDQWYKYSAIIDTIAPESIDNNLVYRSIGITYTYFGYLGLYQRNLENFDVSTIYKNTSNEQQPCFNCHSFCNNSPDKMSLHIRQIYPGTAIFNEGELKKINTKTKYTMSPAAYTAWHPNGNLIAYSVNRLFVNYTSDMSKIAEVWDQSSDIIVYDIKTNTITTSPKISTQSRENLPNWSPDGKWLYFISAPKVNDENTNLIDEKYSLLRIAFNESDMSWGDVDTVISSKQTGKSITFPVSSPDGRFLVFCMIDHGYFSIFDKNSNLYLFDLNTGQYHKLDILNSSSTDSYHGFSKNGRWMVFSSKRLDDVCTRPFFAYFDKNGNFHKPFVLPQKDPLFYKSDNWNYNLPALVDGKVKIKGIDFRDRVSDNAAASAFDKSVNIDALSGATYMKKQ
jgi:Tol biopolymer transport system component